MVTKGLILVLLSVNVVFGRLQFRTPNSALDQDLYESVLDAEQCHEQVRYVRSNLLLSMRCKWST